MSETQKRPPRCCSVTGGWVGFTFSTPCLPPPACGQTAILGLKSCVNWIIYSIKWFRAQSSSTQPYVENYLRAAAENTVQPDLKHSGGIYILSSPSAPSGEDEVYPQDCLRTCFKLRNMLWWLLLSLSSQEAGFTGFMRSLRGRDQEKVVKRKEELWEKHAGSGGAAWGGGAMHCDPWAWQRALSALTGETRQPQRKAIFLYRGDSVCNNTRVLAVRPTTWDYCFSRMFWWEENTQTRKKRKGFLVFAQPLWLNMWKATPYTVSMQYCPMLSSAGVCVTVRPPWWWTGGGHQYLTVEVALSQWVLIQPHQPCSVSKRDKCWLLTYTFWFQWFGGVFSFFFFCLFFLFLLLYRTFTSAEQFEILIIFSHHLESNGILTPPLKKKERKEPKACTVKCEVLQWVV